MGLSFSPAGGGGGRTVFTPSQSPFADNAARDTWALANLSDVRNSATEFTRITVAGNIQEWGGTDTPTSTQCTHETIFDLKTQLIVRTSTGASINVGDAISVLQGN